MRALELLKVHTFLFFKGARHSTLRLPTHTSLILLKFILWGVLHGNERTSPYPTPVPSYRCPSGERGIQVLSERRDSQPFIYVLDTVPYIDLSLCLARLYPRNRWCVLIPVASLCLCLSCLIPGSKGVRMVWE